jgi:hypothetical protein
VNKKGNDIDISYFMIKILLYFMIYIISLGE